MPNYPPDYIWTLAICQKKKNLVNKSQENIVTEIVSSLDTLVGFLIDIMLLHILVYIFRTFEVIFNYSDIWESVTNSKD